MISKSEFGRKLKSAMASKGISQKELSAKINISPAMLSNYVTARNFPPADILGELANQLGVSADWLLDIEHGKNSTATITTLGDVIRFLFNISAVMDVRVRDIEVPFPPGVEAEDGEESEMKEIVSCAEICHIPSQLKSALDDWAQIRELKMNSDIVNKSLLPAWMKEIATELDHYDLRGKEITPSGDPTKEQ